MMVRVCDRCDQLIKGAAPFGTATIVESAGTDLIVELCPDCLRALRSWLRPKEEP